MKHLDIRLGDFVAQEHPKEGFCLKKGIVVASKETTFIIQWLSYNKDFFMECEDSVFEELNSLYLLTKMSYNRSYNIDITILSKAG